MILPSVIELNNYTWPPREKAITKTPLKIGWIGTPTTYQAYIPGILPVLERVNRTVPIEFHIIGSSRATLGAFPCPVVFTEWSSATETMSLENIDIGIMPLTDTPWARGKCAYKLIQYMAAGKPVIASNVGANRDVVDDGVNGLLVDTHSEWCDAIVRMAHDSELRARMGQAGRKKVENQFCYSVTCHHLAVAFHQLLQQQTRQSVPRCAD